ncbi:cyanidin 3-O-galactoside 2''-O-xylosyltransferase FGGT1-like [Macadamia integrifolia]|uniref:cyanidin 3-O-galactoside 2''-O-xylosyltransferase FGGT1-like n=1 Tax=Macadamia integrifolia TaxID=60698 RepID=UPI001C4EAE66|nr:cyanidin 3-O-galactoside 2''-O-xylosyltransferase FGGT1-like [Macadamia integrifolia]
MSMMTTTNTNSLSIAMFPWFAFGHLHPYLHLSNKLAQRGHSISFLIPSKVQPQLEKFNHYPHLITFIPLVVPQVPGLPPGAATMSDVPLPMAPLLVTALFLMQDQVEAVLNSIQPNLIFFDVAHWIPALARRFGIVSIHYSIVGVSSIAHHLVPARSISKGQHYTELMRLWPGFPSFMQLHTYEARPIMEFLTRDYIDGMTFGDILMASMRDCDAIALRAWRDVEGPYCDYLESQYGKQVFLTGPTLPDLPTTKLEDRWVKWLGRFKRGTVVYCSLGSECALKKEELQELVLGLESTGFPFLAVLKPPFGCATVEEVLPEGFQERVEGRGVVHGGWVQQTLILGHPSVGCFVTHCGGSSTWESLMNDCQVVVLPQIGDHFFKARLLIRDLKVAVEVERREEDGWFTKEDVCKAVKLVMDDDSKVGREVRANHARWKDMLLRPDLESSYLDSFMEKLYDITKTAAAYKAADAAAAAPTAAALSLHNKA